MSHFRWLGCLWDCSKDQILLYSVYHRRRSATYNLHLPFQTSSSTSSSFGPWDPPIFGGRIAHDSSYSCTQTSSIDKSRYYLLALLQWSTLAASTYPSSVNSSLLSLIVRSFGSSRHSQDWPHANGWGWYQISKVKSPHWIISAIWRPICCC